jgi:hypothetical protein
MFESGVQDPKPPRPLSHRMVPPVLAEVPAKLRRNPAAIRIKATVKQTKAKHKFNSTLGCTNPVILSTTPDLSTLGCITRHTHTQAWPMFHVKH